MSEEYGNDFITLQDEDGVETEFEHLDTLTYNGKMYMAFIPAEMTLAPEADVVILRLEQEGEEEVLVSVDDEAELEAVYEEFVSRMDEKDFYEQVDEEDEEEDESGK